VRDCPFTMHDAEGGVCLVDTEAGLTALAADAFERLVAAKRERQARRLAAQRARAERKAKEEGRLAAVVAAFAGSLQSRIDSDDSAAAPPSVHRTVRLALQSITDALRTRPTAAAAFVPLSHPTAPPPLPPGAVVPSSPSMASSTGTAVASAVPDSRPDAAAASASAGGVVLLSAAEGGDGRVDADEAGNGSGSEREGSEGGASIITLTAVEPGPKEVDAVPQGADAGAGGGAEAGLRSSDVSLSLADLQCCFLRKSDLDAAMALLDLDGSGAVSRDEFLTAARLMFGARAAARTALGSYGK
jgi:hypothetical protein